MKISSGMFALVLDLAELFANFDAKYLRVVISKTCASHNEKHGTYVYFCHITSPFKMWDLSLSV